MSVCVYLLSLTDLKTSEQLEEFSEAASLRVDLTRRRKAEEIRNPRGQAVSLGAGMLLQKMAADYQSGKEIRGERYYTAAELLSELRTPLPLQYRFGAHGKPFIVGFPLYFSISHSGDYVLCAASERAVGADIQQFQPIDFPGFARRFFTEEECIALEGCDSEPERQRVFFRLWTRKEAFGKLTGQGVMSVLNRANRRWSEAPACGSAELCAEWVEIAAPGGYAIAVCIGDNLPYSRPCPHT